MSSNGGALLDIPPKKTAAKDTCDFSDRVFKFFWRSVDETSDERKRDYLP